MGSHAQGSHQGKLLSPTKRKNAAQMLMDKYQISERSACGLVGLSRTTWRHLPIPRDYETPMRAEVIRLTSNYGRYGYRTTAILVRSAGWLSATLPKVARIWREEGLKFPQKQPPRGLAMVKRWKLHAPASYTSQSCLEL